MISNNAEVMVDAADMSINWLDLTMYGLKGALDALTSPTVCELFAQRGREREVLIGLRHVEKGCEQAEVVSYGSLGYQYEIG